VLQGNAELKRKHGAITSLSVVLVSKASRTGRLVAGGLSIPCAIGRTGRAALKREGDGASPIGSFEILGGYFRSDRFAIRPRSALPLRPLRPDQGWCDDPGDRNYNRPVRLPYAAGHERMWREDGLYDLVLVLDCNLRPRSRQRGSAIFLHLARPNFEPTAGCVAIRRADMLALLARLVPGATIRI
jgi:L,D-peptidoglycan transpeptidase YkuD (ErfK/YbiS/YcfS/YnhG family)